MNSPTIYIVIGSTGEYSDRTEWPQMAFATEEEAEAHVVKCDERARKWQGQRKDSFDEMPDDWMGDLGPTGGMQYTGNSYWVEPCLSRL